MVRAFGSRGRVILDHAAGTVFRAAGIGISAEKQVQDPADAVPRRVVRRGDAVSVAGVDLRCEHPT